MELDLVAQGHQGEHRWRRSLADLADGESIVIGRTSGSWAVPWDDRISREHVRVAAVGPGLTVERMPQARNPVYYQGQRVDKCVVDVGDHFVIGSTTFTVARHPVADCPDEPSDLTQHAFDAQQLRRNPFRDADKRIAVLGRLPDLITGSTSDDELWVRVASVLLHGILGSSEVAVVQCGNDNAQDVRVVHYDSRVPCGKERAPSAGLVRKAIASNESVLHLWNGQRESAFTESEGLDWAFCVPISGEQRSPFALYVAGTMAGLTSNARSEQTAQASIWLQDDLKFSELVATTIANLRNMRELQQRQAGLHQFFSPVVMNALVGRETEDTLMPREADISVLFCDLRGFSRQIEQAQDRLLQLLERVSEALGVMTRHILASGGVIGDFHGDAAMGFWGWPLSQIDAPARACAAALAIQEEFSAAATDPSHRLADFRCGIGVASGRSVAGRIGTVDQVKVTAFGPAVNLASRLEGMTKQLAAEILVDDVSADFIRTHVPRDVCRIRRLAPIRPFGVQTPLMVSQILPPLGPRCSLTDDHLRAYEEALDALLDRQWELAFDRLHDVPASDRAKDFLTVFIAQHGRVAPPGWSGVIDLPKH